MKRFALLTATLMLGGAAIAQDTGYDDPATPDTAVSSDTATQADTTTNTEATTSSTDVMSDTDAAAESTTTSTTSTDTTTTSTDATGTTTTTTTATGVGGPYEPAPAPTASMPVASAIPSPTSKGGYPPCDGSESADSCIQLYERGVKTETNLAMNNSLPGGDSATMTASAETATPSGQLSADATMSTTATTSPAEPATGVGGPYEPVEAGTTSKKDYPPCSGAESDDSCIQLYERGVTGADN